MTNKNDPTLTKVSKAKRVGQWPYF